MGKRRSSYQAKDEPEVSPSDVESNAEPEKAEATGAVKLTPSQVREFSEILEKIIEQNPAVAEVKLRSLKTSSDVEKYPEVVKFLSDHGVEFADAVESFGTYFTRGALKLRIDIARALPIAKWFSFRAEAIREHPNFPKPPLNPFHRFLEEHHMSLKNVDQALVQNYRKQREGDDSSVEIYRSYAAELQSFLEAELHNLNSEQKKYVKAQIKSAEKKGNVEPPAKKAKKEKASPKTAYEFWLTSLEDIDRYDKYDPAKRDAKLLKRFNGLDDGIRQIFVTMARNQKK